MNGYGKIWAVKFAEPATGAGIGIFYYRSGSFILFKNFGRTESNTDAATLAPVFKNLLNKELFALLVKLLFCFPVAVRILFRVRWRIAFLFSFRH